jgi:parvulin-like peptidyl-prolyl isomerase
VPAAPVISPEERLTQEWKENNSVWIRANIDGSILTMFDVRKNVSPTLQSVRTAAMVNAKDAMVANYKAQTGAKSVIWEILPVPQLCDNQGRILPPEIQAEFKQKTDEETQRRLIADPRPGKEITTRAAMQSVRTEMALARRLSPDSWLLIPNYQLRERRWETLPDDVQAEFKQKTLAESERRLAANPGANRDQITGESLVAAREQTAQSRGQSPDEWEIANTESGDFFLRTVQWETLPPEIQAHFRRQSDEQLRNLVPTVERSTLKDLADDQLRLREAREKGVNLPPSMIKGRIDELVRREPDSDPLAFSASLEAQGITPREHRRLVSENMIIEYMRGEEMKPYSGQRDLTLARVSPKRIRERYEKVKADRFTAPAQPTFYSYRQLRLTPTSPAETDTSIREQAKYIQDEVAKGTPFADLVKRDFNKDPQRNNDGGSGSWYELGKLNEKVRDILTALPDGGVSVPIEFPRSDGRPDIFFIQRVACKPGLSGAVTRLEDVQDEIANELANEDKRASSNEFLERLGGFNGKYFHRHYDRPD